MGARGPREGVGGARSPAPASGRPLLPPRPAACGRRGFHAHPRVLTSRVWEAAAVMDIDAEREKITKEIKELERILDPCSSSINVDVSDSSLESDSDSGQRLGVVRRRVCPRALPASRATLRGCWGLAAAAHVLPTYPLLSARRARVPLTAALPGVLPAGAKPSWAPAHPPFSGPGLSSAARPLPLTDSTPRMDPSL